MNEKEIVSNYMKSLAVKSHEAVVKKHGKEFYSRIGKLGGRPPKSEKPAAILKG